MAQNRHSINPWLAIYLMHQKSLKRSNSDSFTAQYEHNFKSTTSCSNLHMWIMFKWFEHLSSIREMNTFTEPNCNFCMKEHIKTLKNYVITVSYLWKNLVIYRACWHKTNLCWIFLSTVYTSIRLVKCILNSSVFLKLQRLFHVKLIFYWFEKCGK